MKRYIVLLVTSLVVSSVLRGQAVAPSRFGADGGPEASEGDPENGVFGIPKVLTEEQPVDDPSLVADESVELLPERYHIRSVPWRAPDFSQQSGALGWDEETFRIPPELATRVAFWKDIYAKYTTDQGVLHNTDDVTIVYEAMNFSSVMKNDNKSFSAKARARTKNINTKKTEISQRLLRLSKVKKETDIQDNIDRRLVTLFAKDFSSSLFQISRKRDLETLKKRLKEASKKQKIRFQLGQKDKFILGIYYSGRYLRAMEKMFRQERLPVELTRLPFVESSFNIQARSRVGASGIWQFMPRTAKPWMMVNRDVDERNDPMAATEASARLMRANYDQLRSWPLALTAYNHGASGIARAVKKLRTRELSAIIDNYEGRRFGFASSNFYVCFLAALETERNARKLLGDVKWSLEFDGTEIDLAKPIKWETVVAFYDGEVALAELQNPHLTKKVRTQNRMIPKGTFVRIPSKRRALGIEHVSGRMSLNELMRQLALAPIPRTFSAENSEEGSALRSKLGAVSEAAKAMLPFVSEPSEEKNP